MDNNQAEAIVQALNQMSCSVDSMNNNLSQVISRLGIMTEMLCSYEFRQQLNGLTTMANSMIAMETEFRTLRDSVEKIAESKRAIFVEKERWHRVAKVLEDEAT